MFHLKVQTVIVKTLGISLIVYSESTLKAPKCELEKVNKLIFVFIYIFLFFF